MFERISTLFLVDDAVRWRAILWSWLAGTIAGTIASASAVSLDALAFVSIGVSLGTFGIFVSSYLIAVPRTTPMRGPRRTFLDYAYLTATATALVFIERILVNPSTVHAAARDAITSIRNNRPISVENVNIAKTITAGLIRTASSPTIKNQLLSDYAALQVSLGYTEVQRTLADLPAPQRKASIVEGAGRDKTILNSDFAGALFSGCNMVFKRLQFQVMLPGGTVINPRPGCTVAFENVLIRAYTQEIGGIIWLDVIFEGSLLVYKGGNITMYNVLAKDCALDSSIPEPLQRLVRSGLPFSFISGEPH